MRILKIESFPVVLRRKTLRNTSMRVRSVQVRLTVQRDNGSTTTAVANTTWYAAVKKGKSGTRYRFTVDGKKYTIDTRYSKMELPKPVHLLSRAVPF